MVVHYIGDGLVAYPSLPRQDSNTVLVDNRRYRWDLNVESDGSILDRGTYRVQVKSVAEPNGQGNYHPDISMLYLGIMMTEKSNIYTIGNLLVADDAAGMARLADVQEQLLDQLAQRPPATDQLGYLQ